MLTKSSLAIDIGSGTIKILYGNKNKIRKCGIINTPADSVVDNKIVDIEKVYNIINDFILKNKIKPKSVSYTISGQDIVIRHIEMPYMKGGNLKQTVDWEIGQNLPEAGKNFYIDYEIQSIKGSSKTKTCQAIAVAAPKQGIDDYVALTNKLKLKLNAIDISSNCIARVFKKPFKGKEKQPLIVILDIGYMNTGIAIMNEGKLLMERVVSFGTGKLLNEIQKRVPQAEKNPDAYLNNEFNFDKIDMEDETKVRIRTLLDNVFSSFQKVIQFYTTGKVEKNISQMYVIGAGNSILGLKEYLENYFSCPVTIVDKPSSIGCKIKIPERTDFKYYVSAYGILLREDN